MQHKSIFAQTGRATYINLMTMQSQGGTTNETKCNYCSPPIWKQKKPLLHSHLRLRTLGREHTFFITTQRYNWLSCHYWDRCLGSSLWFSLADGSATTVFLTSMNWLKNRELQEVLSYWHSNSIPQEIYQFTKMLSWTKSEPNKINSSQPPSACFIGKQCMLLSEVSEMHWKQKKATVLTISFPNTLPPPVSLLHSPHTRWLPHFSRIIMCHGG